MIPRRQVVRAIPAVTLPAVAGCTGQQGGETETPTRTAAATPTATETAPPTATPTPTAAMSAQAAYPDYNWAKLEGVDPTPSSTITMRNFEFNPLVVAVTPGTDLPVENEDSSTHTITIPGLDVDTTVSANASASVTAEQTGTFDYVCTFHPPGMLGRLVVTDETPTPVATPTATPTPTEADGATSTETPTPTDPGGYY